MAGQIKETEKERFIRLCERMLKHAENPDLNKYENWSYYIADFYSMNDTRFRSLAELLNFGWYHLLSVAKPSQESAKQTLQDIASLLIEMTESGLKDKTEDSAKEE